MASTRICWIYCRRRGRGCYGYAGEKAILRGTRLLWKKISSCGVRWQNSLNEVLVISIKKTLLAF